MIEELLTYLSQYPIAATLIVIASSILIFLAAFKSVAYMIAKATKTKKDDEVVDKVYKALDKHKDTVEAVHKVAKKIEEKKKD